jgi:hypothetical protein
MAASGQILGAAASGLRRYLLAFDGQLPALLDAQRAHQRRI